MCVYLLVSLGGCPALTADTARHLSKIAGLSYVNLEYCSSLDMDAASEILSAGPGGRRVLLM